MEEIFMIDKAKSMKLQNLIVNSMYAAVIESELNSETAHQLITGGQEVKKNFTKWLGTAAGFHQGANVKMNGVKIPHLFPGESLNLKTPGNADNGFGELESSFLRNIAAGFNVSYEQLARDYSKVNYSSGRMSNNETWRYFLGRRKMIACKFASSIFSLVFEEMVNRNIITLPRKARYNFYDRKAAWCNAEWIGSGRLSIDGLKEVKEAILRIESGLSTYEKELAVMGEDYQEIFSQQVREMKERKEKGLPPASWAAVQAFAPEQQTEGEAA
jgi:lambda family phage portal protein